MKTGQETFVMPSLSKTICDQIRSLISDARTIQNKANGESRALTESEDLRLTAIANQIEALDEAHDVTLLESAERDEAGNINPLDCVRAAERRLKKPQPLGIDLGKPRDAFTFDAPTNSTASRPGALRGKDVSYRNLFGAPRGTAGRSLSDNDWLCAVAAGSGPNPELGIRYQAVANEGSGPAGGYSVPSSLAERWLDAAIARSVIAPLCSNWAMTSDTLRIPGFDASSNTETLLFGGLSPEWIDEAEELSESAPKLRMIELIAKKIGLLVPASNELISDANGWGAQLEGAMSAAISYSLEKAIISGNGIGRPRGFLNDPAKITVTKDGSQAAATFVAANAAAMYSRLDSRLKTNGVWIMHPDVVPQLFALNQGVESSALFIQRLNDQVNDRLYGLPIYYSPFCSALGTEGDVILCDPSQFALGIREGLHMESSMHVGFKSDVTYFRGIMRCAGQGTWSSATTNPSGNTSSWLVTLETRS